MKQYRFFVFLFFILSLFFPVNVHAQTQILEGQQHRERGLYFTNEIKLPDPTSVSQTIYGALSTPYEIDSYYFIPQKTLSLSIETLRPVSTTDEKFLPAWEIIGAGIPPQPMTIELSVPSNSHDVGHDYFVPPGTRATIYDPLSFGLLYRGNKQKISVLAGNRYYLNIFDPFHYRGDYVVKITNQTTETPSLSLQKAPSIMFNLVDDTPVPWIDIWGIFFTIVGIVLGCSILFTKMLFDIQNVEFRNLKKTILFSQISALIIFGIGECMLYKIAIFSRTALIQLVIYIFISAILLYIAFCDKRNTTKKKGTRDTTAVILLLLSWLTEMFLFSWYILIMR